MQVDKYIWTPKIRQNNWAHKIRHKQLGTGIFNTYNYANTFRHKQLDT